MSRHPSVTHAIIHWYIWDCLAYRYGQVPTCVTQSTPECLPCYLNTSPSDQAIPPRGTAQCLLLPGQSLPLYLRLMFTRVFGALFALAVSGRPTTVLPHIPPLTSSPFSVCLSLSSFANSSISLSPSFFELDTPPPPPHRHTPLCEGFEALCCLHLRYPLRRASEGCCVNRVLLWYVFLARTGEDCVVIF